MFSSHRSGTVLLPNSSSSMKSLAQEQKMLLLKATILLVVSVPSAAMSSKLRFASTASVATAKQVVHRKVNKDELLEMRFWNPTTGIWLKDDRSLQSYILSNGVRMPDLI